MRQSEGRQDGARTPAWAQALRPLGALFLGAARMKALLYARGLLRRRTLPALTVSVGNLTFGGTGKTPVALALARLLRDGGERPAVLLRGYGRRTQGPLRVQPGSRPDEVGEEALLYALSLPDVPVAVAERREEGASLLAREAPTVFVLDDAFQHQRVARDLDLLVVDASRPGDLRAPPAGRLREPLSAAARAHLLVVTRGEEPPAALGAACPALPRIRARFTWTDEPLARPASLSWKDFAGRRVVAFAGVGHPQSFFDQARREGIGLAAALVFPDHAEPTGERLRALEEALKETGAAALLTTEKDAVKWAAAWHGPAPLVWPRLTASFEDPGGLLPALLSRARAGRQA